MKQLIFYFDFLSPFSYFAWMKLQQLVHEKQLKIEYKPTPLGPLLNHWQIKGPGEVTPKREFLLKQCLRYSKRFGLPFTTPQTHPFNSLYALRLALKGVAGDHQEKVISTLWSAGWQKRIDMGNPDELLAALRDNGLPHEELYEKSFSREAKAELKANIQQALAAGVFGVPSFTVGTELFWGNDALPDVMDFLEGTDLLDRVKLESLLTSTPRAAVQHIP
ncbi:MAG TPA: 2-hydroxychromene-2-carboxylate isomerase [Bacteriovoracaceae bacterium]|nr:2-hydroxychromene-2-carboxylate isomerase [Bacteriovoracaceae bacterium]